MQTPGRDYDSCSEVLNIDAGDGDRKPGDEILAEL